MATTVLSVMLFSHALLLLGGSGGILLVTGSPPPRVVEPNNNDGVPCSLIRIGSNKKGGHGHVTASDDSSLSLSAADDAISLLGESNAKEDVVVTDAESLTSSRVLQADAPTCTAGYVDCVKGIVRGTSISCTEECDGKCCVGYVACKNFTGKVCKDESCNADRACLYATIPFVVNSCKDYEACTSARISSSLNNCCNTKGECYSYSDAKLPAACLVRDKYNTYLITMLHSTILYVYPFSLFVMHYR